ncbi:uncharacterized protein LOC135400291 [Ornithodoros turicata]|uniref:uncharacterized protein LOC135400291 n=1 Tax=Ornithodoros turicata TaxID=34597 RepID=UPI0031393E50
MEATMLFPTLVTMAMLACSSAGDVLARHQVGKDLCYPGMDVSRVRRVWCSLDNCVSSPGVKFVFEAQVTFDKPSQQLLATLTHLVFTRDGLKILSVEQYDACQSVFSCPVAANTPQVVNVTYQVPHLEELTARTEVAVVYELENENNEGVGCALLDLDYRPESALLGSTA